MFGQRTIDQQGKGSPAAVGSPELHRQNLEKKTGVHYSLEYLENGYRLKADEKIVDFEAEKG